MNSNLPRGKNNKSPKGIRHLKHFRKKWILHEWCQALDRTGFFIYKYVITISHKEKLDIKSGGRAAFSSTSNESNGLNIGEISFGSSQSQDENEENSYLSQIISSSQTKTTISYGSSTKPVTFIFDMKFIDTKTIPYNLNNRPYIFHINNKDEIILPNCQIIYTTIDIYAVDVIHDPSTMTFNNLPKNPHVRKWKDRISHHKRGYGHYNHHVQINLSPFWEFNQPITIAFLSSYGSNYLNLTYINSHSFKIEFYELPNGT